MLNFSDLIGTFSGFDWLKILGALAIHTFVVEITKLLFQIKHCVQKSKEIVLDVEDVIVDSDSNSDSQT